MVEKDLHELLTRLERVERELEELKENRQESTQAVGKSPPIFIEKIENILRDELVKGPFETEDLLVLASFRKEGGKIVDSLSIASREEPTLHESPEGVATALEASKQALEILQTLSNERRLQILIEVSRGGRYPKELASTSGLEGGGLYHHLDVLTESRFIERDELGKIVLTSRGKLLTNLIYILSKIKQWKFSSEDKHAPQRRLDHDI